MPANRYPMIVLWGSQLIHAVYNDAYARWIGQRHPAAMGQPNERFGPEVWNINGPLFAGVLAKCAPRPRCNEERRVRPSNAPP